MKRIFLSGMIFILLCLPQAGLCQEYFTDEGRGQQVAKDLTNYITKDSQLKGGFFVLDPKEEKILNLQFERIYDIYKVDSRNYVATVYFRDKEGNQKTVEFSLVLTWLGWQVTRLSLR